MAVERIISSKKKEQVKENKKIKTGFKTDIAKVQSDLGKNPNLNQLTKAVQDLTAVVDRLSRRVFGEEDIKK